MNLESPVASVVVVTHNSAHCIANALLPLAGEDWIRVIVVDNGSLDGTANVARDVIHNATVLESHQNLGFAKGVNLGMQYATGDVFVLLNPDVQISLHALRTLVEKVMRDPKAIIAAPVLKDPRNPRGVINAGREPTVRFIMCHSLGLSRITRYRRLRGFYCLAAEAVGEDVSVSWVSGACLAIRSEVWRQLGGLSERWFMYGEDVEFCLRATRRGIPVQLFPQVHGLHITGESSKSRDGRLQTMWLQNLFDLYKEEYRPGRTSRIWWRLAFAVGFTLRAVSVLIAGTRSPEEAETRGSVCRRFLRFAGGALALR